MSRVFVVAALIASVLTLARHERVLDRTGLFGTCSELSQPAPGGGRWLACRPGDVTGYPDLTRDSCTRGGMRGSTRFWICPASLVAGPSTDETATR
jgi:hypothetical protein